jgi:hypothetical protein
LRSSSDRGKTEGGQMQCIDAYSFRAALSLPEMRTRLNALGPWVWIERDNDRWGEYVSAVVLTDPDRGIVKLFVEEEDRYELDFVLQTERAEDVQAVYDTLFAYLLPALGATEIEPAEHRE